MDSCSQASVPTQWVFKLRNKKPQAGNQPEGNSYAGGAHRASSIHPSIPALLPARRTCPSPRNEAPPEHPLPAHGLLKVLREGGSIRVKWSNVSCSEGSRIAFKKASIFHTEYMVWVQNKPKKYIFSQDAKSPNHYFFFLFF